MSTSKKLSFHGDGMAYFVMSVVNLLLCIVTVYIYIFWAIAKSRAFIYQNTEFAGSRFAYHGTGDEMFKGAIKAIGLIIGVSIIVGLLAYFISPLFVILTYAFLFLILPYAIHGSLKYNLAKTSWRGIHMGYRGVLTEFTKLFYVELLLTLVTFGFYGSWANVKITKYIVERVRLGNIGYSFKGEGDKLFVLNLVGILLTIVSLGLYFFKFSSDRFKYYVDNTKIVQDGKEYDLKATTTGMKFFVNTLTSSLLILFTLGIALPWVIIKDLKFVYENVEIDGALDTDNIIQTEEDYSDATGDGLGQLLGIEF